MEERERERENYCYKLRDKLLIYMTNNLGDREKPVLDVSKKKAAICQWNAVSWINN